MRHVGFTLAHKGQVQWDAHAFAMQAINVGRRIVYVGLIDNLAHADVAALSEDVLHLQRAVAAAMPIVVLHLATMHVDNARSTIHSLVQVYLAVFECHHNARGFKRRTRLPKVAHSIVFHFVVLAVLASCQVDDGLHVASLHLHHDHDTHLAVHQFFLQLAAKGAVGKVLYVDVDRRKQVMPVLCLRVDDGNSSVANGNEVLRARLPPQDAVETQFEAALRLAARIVVELADGAACQPAVWLEAKQHLVGMEAALVHRLPQER